MGIVQFFLQADDDEEVREMIDWLREGGLLPTPDFKPGRTPTYAELREALDQMKGFKIEYVVTDQHWDAHFDTPDGVNVWLYSENWDDHPTKDENKPCEICWKNTPEVAALPFIQTLANICGTITISNDTDLNELVFVYPQTQPKA